ncbi:MAG TPA: MATE family efflux transporter [Longimicrobiaceae bacterium]|nr:MATE family efflux transporter [Longimicrobiaceae bacterium]
MSSTLQPPEPRASTRRPASRDRRRGALFARELRQLLVVAGPLVVSQLGQVGMTAADTIMVGPLGAEALAAAGLGSALHVAMLMLFTGTVLGMTPLVSQAFGAGDRDRCRAVLVQGIWMSVALSLPLAWLTFLGGDIARLFGQEPGVAELAGEYMDALAWSALPALLFLAFRQFLEGMGITTPAMVMTFLGLAVNVAANAALIFGWGGLAPAMGVVGSGWATTITRWAMLGAMLAYLWLDPRLHPFRGVRWRPDRELLRRIAAIGVPIGAQLGVEVGLISFTAVMVGWFGPVELAAHQVTINLASVTFMVALGVSLAGSIRVGQHVGARSARGVRRATLATYLCAVGFMSLCALAFFLFPQELVGLYTSDPAIVRVASALLLVAALFQVFDGAQVAGLCALRGAADTRVPMLMALVGYWGIGVPVAYYLGFRTTLGPAGVWAGLSAALAVVAVLLAWRARRVLWDRDVLLRAAPARASAPETSPAPLP